MNTSSVDAPTDVSNWQRRWNPVLGEWSIIAARTANRPWAGKQLDTSPTPATAHDPKCPLCPRNTRATGQTNPDYTDTWLFDNDFATFSAKAPHDPHTRPPPDADPLSQTASNQGRCQVICWSPRHDMTLARLPLTGVEAVVNHWCRAYAELAAHDQHRYILMFENKGQEVGVSNPHPHGQIYATDYLPLRPKQIAFQMQSQAKAKGEHTLLSQLLAHKTWQAGIIEDTTHCVHLVPWAARFPYESWIIPKRAVASMDQLNADERRDYAALFHRASIRYDNLFQRDCPNVTLHYNAPVNDEALSTHWHFFTVFQPPLRNSHTLKYLAGFESGTQEIVNPVLPESAATQLRNCATTREPHS